MIPLSAFASKTVLVLGAGMVGQSLARAAHVGGARVLLFDDFATSDPHVCDTMRELVADGVVEQVTAQSLPRVIAEVGAVFPSPGIAPTHHVIQHAATAGIPLFGELDLLRMHVPQATVVGITGTNGKSTTTALLGHILHSQGIPVAVGGNLGPAMLTLDSHLHHGVYVLELSSFQLYWLNRTHVDVAVWLNFSPDHLNWHGSINAYRDAKMNIFRRGNSAQNAAVAHRESPVLRSDVSRAEAPYAAIGVDDAVSCALYEAMCLQSPHVSPFSGKHVLDLGVYAHGENIISSLHGPNQMQSLNWSDLPEFTGAHQLQNLAAAITVATLAGVPLDGVHQACATFTGLPHRLEQISERNHIRIINDSKATNPHAASYALRAFPNIHWVAGGISKGGLNTLSADLQDVKSASLYGKAAEDLQNVCHTLVPTTVFHAFDDAVAHALKQAQKSAAQEQTVQTVLLSPACASFDQFANFHARGERFRALCHSLHP